MRFFSLYGLFANVDGVSQLPEAARGQLYAFLGSRRDALQAYEAARVSRNSNYSLDLLVAQVKGQIEDLLAVLADESDPSALAAQLLSAAEVLACPGASRRFYVGVAAYAAAARCHEVDHAGCVVKDGFTFQLDPTVATDVVVSWASFGEDRLRLVPVVFSKNQYLLFDRLRSEGMPRAKALDVVLDTLSK